MTIERMRFTKVSIGHVSMVTDKAVLVQLDDDEKKWIPRSVLSYRSDKAVETDDPTELEIADWFVQKEGLV
jgi:hypothetical protein